MNCVYNQFQALHSWLTRVLYNRRSKFDPLWNTFVVAGLQVPYFFYFLVIICLIVSNISKMFFFRTTSPTLAL